MADKLALLSDVAESKKIAEAVNETWIRNIESRKEAKYLLYACEDKISSCKVRMRKVKTLGTTEIVYLSVTTKNDQVLELTDCSLYNQYPLTKGSLSSADFHDIDNCTAKLKWVIGKDLDEKQVVWVEQFAEIATKEGEVIYSGEHKLWQYTPNGDMWGVSKSFKSGVDGRQSKCHESWKDSRIKRLRDFSCSLYRGVKENRARIYSFGQKEEMAFAEEIKCENRETVKESYAKKTIERREKKTQGDGDFEYSEKYWIAPQPDGTRHLRGEKSGLKGNEVFHEKWWEKDGEKNVEKWSELDCGGSVIQKWGTKEFILQNERQEREKWTELEKKAENFHEIRIERSLVCRDGTNSKENCYENVATGLRVTEKTGFNDVLGYRWECKIIDKPDENYVENVGENSKSHEKWLEKWHDSKKGIKWAVKEGSKEDEHKYWKEKWYEQKDTSEFPSKIVTQNCEKWGRNNSAEWLEKWKEDYNKEGKNLYKFCEKTYKEDMGYHRGYRVNQRNSERRNEEGLELWKYDVEYWENDSYKSHSAEHYE